jgi:hypothetical protein
LKVLAGHPDGRASVAVLTRFVSILISSGPEWTNRTKRLAARAPDLDIFGNAFVLRDDSGWQITGLGRRFLASLEVPVPATINQELPLAPDAEVATTVQPVLRLVVDNTPRPIQVGGPDQTRRSA